MDLVTILVDAQSEILDDAFTALQQLNAVHYESAGEGFTRQRLDDLAQLVIGAIRDRDVAPVLAYAVTIADERFNAGFDVSEVQSAFNVLETAMWRHVVAAEPPDELAEAIGLLSTVFGLAKDTLAREYVSHAAHRHVPSLDLSAMFRGTQA
jgi:hypothetical protein